MSKQHNDRDARRRITEKGVRDEEHHTHIIPSMSPPVSSIPREPNPAGKGAPAARLLACLSPALTSAAERGFVCTEGVL